MRPPSRAELRLSLQRRCTVESRIGSCRWSRAPPLHNQAKDACDHRDHADSKQDHREMVDMNTNDELMLQDTEDGEDRANGYSRDSERSIHEAPPCSLFD